MSILSVAVTSHGLIFAADRNVTHFSRREGDGGQRVTEIHGQVQRPKVLRWPHHKALIGYVGTATVDGIPTDEWLYDFVGDHVNFADFGTLAEDLRSKIESQRRLDEGEDSPQPLIVHLGGFETRDSMAVPVVWYIRNAYQMNRDGYTDIRREFQASDEFLSHMQRLGIHPSDYRARMEELQSVFSSISIFIAVSVFFSHLHFSLFVSMA